MSRAAGRSSDEYEDAHRVYKLAKAGGLSFVEMTPREFGLLYLHFPFMLPDVHPEEVVRER